MVTLPSGLLYKVLRKGEGKAHPTVSSPCSCHYEGKLIDGSVFDSSYARGSPTTFAPNQVIKGWTEVRIYTARMRPGVFVGSEHCINLYHVFIHFPVHRLLDLEIHEPEAWHAH